MPKLLTIVAALVIATLLVVLVFQANGEVPALAAPAVTPLTVNADEPGQAETYAAAYRRALHSRHPLAVLVTATWCRVCPQAEREIPRMARHAIVVKLDADKDAEIVNQISPGPVPRLHIFRRKGKGWSVESYVGTVEIDKWLAEVEREDAS